MKKLTMLFILCSFLICFISGTGRACTTFSCDDNGQPIFGKNYDWHLERGVVMINKRGVSKTAPEEREINSGPFAKWTSKYGSLTFNQYGRGFPMGGMNEAGLVVEVMSLKETEYPAPDSRPSLGNLQWVQYQLDNFSNVEQIIAGDSQVRINPDEFGIHFLVADKEGNCASIEFIDGQLVYHKKGNMPVRALTNNTYAESLTYLKRHYGFGGTKSISNSVNSLDRFVRAAYMLKNHNTESQTSPVDYAFNILANVVNPAASWGTKWSIVYDIQNLRIYFRTFSNKQIRYMDLHSFDFSCQTPVNVLDMNLDKSGDMTDNFRNYTQQMNLDLIRHSFRETYFLTGVPYEALVELSKYPESFSCK